ncbi:MAG: hypothetical protein LBN30_04395 [Oscillospiraceae bacterium]|jgi:peptidoglycan hydrolase CwlO-like protein|nr:hypothetical protein [Oscillospiraceae bacterium]
MSAAERALVSRRAVIKYIVGLVAVVLFFLVLSYFMHVRSDDQLQTLYDENASAQQKIESLQSENIALNSSEAELKAKLDVVQAQLDKALSDLGKVQTAWAEDTRQLEETYRASYNELVVKYNELLAQNTTDI